MSGGKAGSKGPKAIGRVGFGQQPKELVSVPERTTPAGAESSAGDYAERERNAKALESFAGGSEGVYIGGGAVTVVFVALLVILLV
jgi:hypothetical protein